MTIGQYFFYIFLSDQHMLSLIPFLHDKTGSYPTKATAGYLVSLA